MKKKILINVQSLCCDSITGIGRYVYECINELSKRDFEIYVYGFGSIKHKEKLPENIFYLKSYRINGVKSNFFIRAINLIGLIFSPIIENRYIKKNKIDIYWGPGHNLPYFKINNLKYILTIHDLVFTKYPETMRKKNYLLESIRTKSAINKADAILACSESTKKDIVEKFGTKINKINVAYLGANFPQGYNEQGTFVDRYNYDFILFVGTLEPRKNLKNLLKAIELLKKRDALSGMKLLMVGGKGWGGVNIEKLVFEYGISQHIVMCGYVSDQELDFLYRNAKFLVYPSIYEGFGLPILEAIVRDTPVVTSNVSSMPEVLGDAGVLINDPFNPHSIAEAILYMTKNYNNYSHELKKQANKFSWEKTIDVFQESIKSV